MKIILGVSASVAAYKAAELARLLIAEGADVTSVMTPNATKLVDPRLFDAVTGRPTITDLFARESAFAHLETARGADAFAVAPATANVLAKLAAGIADDALTTVALAVECGRLVAPAMNPKMWDKAEVQRNVSTLRELGYVVVPPEEGTTACGDVGYGRLADVHVIAEDVLRLAYPGPGLTGRTVVVTAGPTREPFDAVRILTNPSSGLMGFEVARRAARRRADVILISAAPGHPTALGHAVRLRRVDTAAEMFEATAEAFEKADALVMAAAVSDYRFDEQRAHKIKKTKGKISTTLVPTVDILSEITKIKRDKLVVGFAAETDNLVENAKDKLLKKGADIIVGNVVGRADVGFGRADAEAVIVTGEGVEELGKISKAALAERVIDELERWWGGVR
ncbi:MAG: bifunctional phosphopantothenoylcysteine decarboxylase/phosphopantothenate--cysteine ligase CoaBC [candidate division Zixibacteria bacterium]|nr:bifunctional phosphopantothenoylcysteine decarboxylase/phosphopantothenate--cysteine ligase CoaBC [candidate division Zixibacteria bacterium]